MTDWDELLGVLRAGPTLAWTAEVREFERSADGRWAPAARPDEADVRAWGDGPRLRVDRADGSPLYRRLEGRAWRFFRPGTRERPLTGETELRYVGPHQGLIEVRADIDWSGTDFTTPAGPVTLEDCGGREAWTVELAPPPRKRHPMRIWVDVESGQQLRWRNEGFAVGAELVRPEFGRRPVDEHFRWDGPAVTEEELAAERAERTRADLEWFADQVAPDGLVVDGVDLTPHWIDRGSDGSFVAGAEGHRLHRRPRGEGSWDGVPGAGTPSVRWSTPEWNWQLEFSPVVGDDEALDRLWRLLHPGHQVDRVRRS